ncbi:MAG TPA: DUF2490 domain-containing protein [Hymenobacter sp.]|uniref:DUF2490 domain-containing protein n=1 Tax=Hymenobacter sp. TaxID=1898978 RepID=UPI002ED8CC32
MKNVVWTLLLIILLGCSAVPARAQAQARTTEPWGTWTIATVVLPGSPEHKWGGYAEVQARSQRLLQQFFYNELKGGVSYSITPDFTVMLAGGRYSTSDYQEMSAGPLSVEKRLWQQLVFVHQSSRLKIEHRYRVEQRWFTFRDDSTEFRQRLRYRLNAFLPLNHKTIKAGTLFLSAYDEVFFNPKGPVFERNRIYGGLGYQANSHFSVQAGWVRQANYNQPSLVGGQYTPRSTLVKNNMVLTVIYRLTPHKSDKPSEALPSQQD